MASFIDFESEEFKAVSVDQIHEIMDRDHADGFGHSMAMTTMREDDIEVSRKEDFSMGAYFKNRSSYPFPNLNGEITLLGHVSEEPERDLGNVSRRSVARKYNDDDSLFASMQEPAVPRGSPKLRQDSIFGNMEESGPRTSPQDSMFAIAEKESGATEAPVKMEQDSLFAPFQRKSTPGNKILTPRNSNLFEPIEKGSPAEEANISDSSIRSLKEFFADTEKSPMSSTEIMEYVLDYCRMRHERGSGRGIVHELGKREKNENLSMLSRRLSQELGDRRVSYNDFSTSLRKKISSSRCSTPDIVSVKSTGSSSSSVSSSSRKSSTSTQPDRSSPPNISRELVPSRSQISEKKVKVQDSRQDNMENQNPVSNGAPPQQVQIQLNLPQNSIPPMQNFHGPLIINIVCPVGYSQGSTVQRVDVVQPNSSQVINVRSDNQPQSQSRLSSSSSGSHIAVKFSGCIEWK